MNLSAQVTTESSTVLQSHISQGGRGGGGGGEERGS